MHFSALLQLSPFKVAGSLRSYVSFSQFFLIWATYQLLWSEQTTLGLAVLKNEHIIIATSCWDKYRKLQPTLRTALTAAPMVQWDAFATRLMLHHEGNRMKEGVVRKKSSTQAAKMQCFPIPDVESVGLPVKWFFQLKLSFSHRSLFSYETALNLVLCCSVALFTLSFIPNGNKWVWQNWLWKKSFLKMKLFILTLFSLTINSIGISIYSFLQWPGVSWSLHLRHLKLPGATDKNPNVGPNVYARRYRNDNARQIRVLSHARNRPCHLTAVQVRTVLLT